MLRAHSGDSYVVNITPASNTFPAIQIIRRRKSRQRGRVAQEADLAMLGRVGDFDDREELTRLATQIGMQILCDSGIVRGFCPWMAEQGTEE